MEINTAHLSLHTYEKGVPEAGLPTSLLQYTGRERNVFFSSSLFVYLMCESRNVSKNIYPRKHYD